MSQNQSFRKNVLIISRNKKCCCLVYQNLGKLLLHRNAKICNFLFFKELLVDIEKTNCVVFDAENKRVYNFFYNFRRN